MNDNDTTNVAWKSLPVTDDDDDIVDTYWSNT